MAEQEQHVSPKGSVVQDSADGLGTYLRRLVAASCFGSEPVMIKTNVYDEDAKVANELEYRGNLVPDNKCEQISRESPTSIFDTPLSRQMARSTRAPHTRKLAREIIAQAARKLRDAYVNLVDDRVFVQTDIYSKPHHDAFTHAEQDAQGVVSSSITLMRFLLSEPEYVMKNQLNYGMRGLLAVILLLVYKIKTEISINVCNDICPKVISQFLTYEEMDRNGHHLIKHMESLEARILIKSNVHVLVECNATKHAEFILFKYHEIGILTEYEFHLAFSAIFFYYYAAVTNPRDDLLEYLGQQLNDEQLGHAFALIGAYAISILNNKPFLDAPIEILNASLTLVHNAIKQENCRGTRCGPYADHIFPVFALTCNTMLERLKEEISASIHTKLRG